MDKINLLDCTLRDGGYITDWHFKYDEMKLLISNLVDAKMDFVEVGYLNRHSSMEKDSALFKRIEHIETLLPCNRESVMFLAMADVRQFEDEDICYYSGNSIDGIRVVFYKYQVEEALRLCAAIKSKGYKLFVQPMVTIDYTLDEYADLMRRIAQVEPYAVAIVDSFGYMLKQDFRQYFRVLDNILSPDTLIGFHSHNNMQLAFISAQDIFEYETSRRLIIDASLYGMGRGAGNLNTELIANYYNMVCGKKYDIEKIMNVISDVIMPIRETKEWGYSPYFFLTGLNHCHPNFASYLLAENDVTVKEFEDFIKYIPTDMLTKCTPDFVNELYKKFLQQL